MPQYLLLLYADPTGWRTMPLADAQKWMGKYLAWDDKARQAGFYAGGNKLDDQPGRVIRSRSGQAHVTDGPYTEAKEVLGGYYLIEAASYDEAVQRLRDHPHLSHGGTIEVREVEAIR